jgi:tetratricopeptide (TPR) repeat protein
MISKKVDSYLESIDNGSFFRIPVKWIFYGIGVLNLLFPLVLLYVLSELPMSILDAKGSIQFVVLMVWLIIALSSYVSFLLWRNRGRNISRFTLEGDAFIATPVFAYFIQTLGEWIGTYYGLAGLLISLLINIFIGDRGVMILDNIGVGFLMFGLGSMLLLPFIGFFIIIFSRFVSEQITTFSAIANNTSRLGVIYKTEQIEKAKVVNKEEVDQIEKKKNIEDYLKLAVQYRKGGSYEKSIQIYSELLEEWPKNEAAIYGRGESYMKAGAYEKSKEDLLEVVESRKYKKDASRLLGNMLYRDDLTRSEAIKYWNIAEAAGCEISSKRLMAIKSK